MLVKEVLKCIRKKRYINAAEISRDLSIPMGLVEHAIQKLKDLKCLIPVMPLCQQLSCSFCPLKSTCNINTAGVVKSYMLTEKGKKLLEAPSKL